MRKDYAYDQVNERLLEILDDLDAIVYVIDVQTYEILYINKHGKALWGDIQGKRCWESVRRGQTGPCENCINQKILNREILNQNNSDRDETKRHKDFYLDPINNKWLETRAHIIHWLDGKIAKLGIAMDMSERKLMEEELEASEFRFRSLFDNINSGVAVYEVLNNGLTALDYIVKDFNNAALNIEGAIKEDVVGRSLFELRPNIGDYGLIDVFRQVWQTGAPQFYPAKIYIDEKFNNWFENYVYKLPSSELVVVFDDVTEQVQYKQKLLKTNQELETALEEIITIEEELRIQYENLERQERELHDSIRLQEDIIQFLPDATFVIDKQGLVLAWNRAMEEMTGIKAEDIIGKGNYEYAIPFYHCRRPVLVDLILNYDESIAQSYGLSYIQEGKDTLKIEDFYLDVGGSEKYLSIKVSPLYNFQGEVIGAIESIRDVTSRRKAELQLRYIAEHDSMTGLYNRGYFEKVIGQSKITAGIMTGLIISDVDGLKLVNDTLGHQEGDRLLKKSAEILLEACPPQGVITRIGGDEFCVIIHDTTVHELYAVLRKMDRLVGIYNNDAPIIPLSISHGIAYSDNPEETLLQLFKEAEENMYYEKLFHNQSIRSKVVDVLTRALEARDYITEGHADRLSVIVEKIACALEIPEQKVNSLKLFARFHDIGKVGISDAILFKPGKLTPDEFEEMKKHSEIGFRLAQSTPDLVPISDWILKHHEWWNGNGYPFGLVGENIPLECRILAIADAYDSMSNDRPYRQALPYAERIEELRRFAGIQFDPELVKVFLGLNITEVDK